MNIDKRQRETADRHAENMDRVFPVLVQLACDGMPIPDSRALGRLAVMRPSDALAALRDLATAGRIAIEYASGFSGGKGRRVAVILVGEHAGKRTGATEASMRALVKEARADRPRSCSAGRPCLWCERPLSAKATPQASYCSNACAKAHGRHGFGANKRQIEQRVAHIARQPKGCATADEFIAAGGQVYREPMVRHT